MTDTTTTAPWPTPPAGYTACRTFHGPGAEPNTQVTHLVLVDGRGNNGGRPTMCGLTRFDKHDDDEYQLVEAAALPGWSMGNSSGCHGPGITQRRCDACWANALLDDLPIRSIDVCAFCGDCECDGTCMSDIDANAAGAGGPGDDHHDRLERLHDWLRWGQAWEALVHLLDADIPPDVAITATEQELADAENRHPKELGPATCPSCGSSDKRYRFGSPCFDEWHRPFGPPEQGRVPVDPVVVSCAVRYALGRRSYAPGLICDVVRSTWADLGDQREVIIIDVEYHLANRVNRLRRDTDIDIDDQPWIDLLNWMRTETTVA